MAHIGILGGSFNPPHNGHVAIAEFVLAKGWVDEVWVIPCVDHPFGKTLASFSDRLAMCRLAFQGISRVTVSDVEAQLPQPSYTVQTLHALRQQFQHDWSLIVGSDIADNVVAQWKDGSKIPTLADLLTVPRGTSSPIPNISATEVREALKNDRTTAGQIPEQVATYIQSHNLYR